MVCETSDHDHAVTANICKPCHDVYRYFFVVAMSEGYQLARAFPTVIAGWRMYIKKDNTPSMYEKIWLF